MLNVDLCDLKTKKHRHVAGVYQINRQNVDDYRKCSVAFRENVPMSSLPAV